jgi:hypothetical protein
MRFSISIFTIVLMTIVLFQSMNVHASFGYHRRWEHDPKQNQNNMIELPQANVPWSTCSSAGAHFTIESVTGNIWPPVAGQTLALNVSGKVDEEVTSGSYTVQVTYYGITIVNENGDLSALVKLPAPSGPISIAYSQELPSESPAGPYVVTVTAVDQNKAQLLCMVVKFSLSMKGEKTVDKNSIFKILQNKRTKK